MNTTTQPRRAAALAALALAIALPLTACQSAAHSTNAARPAPANVTVSTDSSNEAIESPVQVRERCIAYAQAQGVESTGFARIICSHTKLLG